MLCLQLCSDQYLLLEVSLVFGLGRGDCIGILKQLAWHGHGVMAHSYISMRHVVCSGRVKSS